MSDLPKLDTLWKLVNVAASVRDVAQDKRNYRFPINGISTLYLHTEAAHIVVQRADISEILISAELQAGFGWRVASEQDEAGVYLVAKRRAVIGTLSSARFVITAPESVRLALKLEGCHLELRDLSGMFHFPNDISQR